MIALNNTSIFIGQIKQILHDFNLPMCKIGDKNLVPNSYYIHKNRIYYYNSNEEKLPCFEYNYDSKYLNITDTFKVDNLIYDKATHNYLGRYLRFLRDYKNFNLLSMYNCFDGTMLEKKVAFNLLDDTTTINFDINSNEYIIYKIPISFVQTYSISLHGIKNIEICLYDINDEKKTSTDLTKYLLSKYSYKKLQINNIFHYELPSFDDLSISNNIFMLLKVPKGINTSITILEGKYYDKYEGLNKLSTVVPFSTLLNTDFKIAAQLLSTENMYNNYLLADRIFEYLTGAAICVLSESYDIKRVQLALDEICEKESIIHFSVSNRIYGVWSELDTEIIKYLATKHTLLKYDSLGYVDKHIEKYLIANTKFDTIQFDFVSEEEN